MTTSAKLWTGFGLLTGLLVLSTLAIIIRVQSTEARVAQGAISRVRMSTGREIEIHVLGYALAVNAHLLEVDPRALNVAANEVAVVDKNLAEYERLVSTERERELAAGFAARWREFTAVGETLLAAEDRRPPPGAQQRFQDLRRDLEVFLERELIGDAIETFNVSRSLTISNIDAVERLAIVLLIVGTMLAIGLSVVVGRGIVTAEARRSAVELRYRALFDTINQGYCIIEVIFDDGNRAVDYRFLEVNQAFEKQTGIKAAPGKRMREIAPGHEEHWYKIYGRIAKTGVSERFEQHAEQLGRWYEVDAYRFGDAGDRQVAVLFNDITLRKYEDARLALFARLGEIMRTATDADELLSGVSQAMGENLGAGRCLFNEIDLELNTGTIRSDYHPDTDSLVGVYDLSAYSAVTRAEMEAGKTVVNYDSSADPRTAGYYEKTYAPAGDRAYVAVPLMRMGKWVASLWCSDNKPRVWTDQEVRMMEAIAERAWLAVEKLRTADALRVSEKAASHLAAIVTSSEDAVISKDLNGVIKSWNRGAEHLFGYTATEAVGKPITMLIPDDHLDEEPKILERIRRGESIDHYETVRRRKDGTLVEISLTISPMVDGRGEIIGASKIARDITERRQAEADLRHYREELEQRVIERTLELARTNKELKAEHAHRMKIELEAVRLLKQIVTIQEDERRRIARDLHDDLGQKLTALRLKLENAKKLCEDEPVCDEIDAVAALAARLDADIGFIATELRPPRLEEMGLASALTNHVREWSRFAGVNAEFRNSGIDGTRLSPEIEINLYRIVQEALNNAHKYARAKNLSVMLERRKYDVVMIIEDDGVGFDMNGKPKGKTALGLIGMRERANLLGGTIDIESSKGSGTTVYVKVPAGEDREH